MSDLTGKFSALEAQMTIEADEAHSQRATIETTLENIQTALANINADMLNMRNSLLGAISQSAACFPCPTPTIVVPPINTTPHAINSDKCKRSQAFVATIASILTAMDTLQSFNVIGTFNVLNDAISEVISGIAAGDTVPLPSFPETVNIVGDYISYAGERLFSGVGLMDQFTALESGLVTATYSASSPEAAASAFNASIDGSSASNGAKLLFKAVASNALYSYFFDPASLPDLSAYSGSACGLEPGTCYEFDLSAYTSTVPSSAYGLAEDFDIFSRGSALNTTSGTYTFTPGIIYAGDFYGWTWSVITPGVTVHWQHRAEAPTSATVISEETATSVTPPIQPSVAHTGTFLFFATAPCVIRLCPPA
jgi:hypothetical protein